MINYTMNSQFYCALAVAKVDLMPTGVDNNERHFWFGDVFFKSFVGVFDIENQQLGMGKSVLAPKSVELACVGGCVEPEPTPTPTPGPDPTPTPGPDPSPSPSPVPAPSDGSDDSEMWLWIVIALGALLLIMAVIALYYCRKS